MSSELLNLFLWSAFCLLMEALFSSAELALVSCDKLKLTHRGARGDRRAKIALGLARRPEWFFSTTLLGQNLFIVGNSVLVTFFIFEHLGMDYEFLGLLLAPVILIFGEAVPKSVAQIRANRLVGLLSPIVLFFSYLLYPVIWGLSRLTLLLMGGVRGTLVSGHQVTAESLELFVQESETTPELSRDFKENLLRILALSRQRVREIMTPLTEVFLLREDIRIEEALRLLREEHYSFIPLYQKRSHNITGVVGFYDLLYARDLREPVGGLKSEPVYVPEVMGVRDLYLRLRGERKNFAVVVDELGAAVGVVTMEDILEEVVGEIEDEYDLTEQLWKQVAPSQYLIQGRAKVDDINQVFRWDLPKKDYETLAGFLMDRFGHIPKSGEILPYGQLTFLVKAATARSIEEVLVEIGERT